MSFRLAALVVMLTGFISLSFEILWFRVFSFATAGAPWTFGRVLAAFLIGLAEGALVSRRFVKGRRDAGNVRSLRVVAAAIAAATLIAYLVVPGLAWLAEHVTWQLGFFLVAAAALVLGLVLPIVSHLGIAPEEAVGARLSYLYFANIVGSALGSLITGFVLADTSPTSEIAQGLVLCGLAVAGAVALEAERVDAPHARRTRGARALGVFAATAGVAAVVIATERPLFDRLYERLLYKRDAAAHESFADVVETRAGVIAVTPQKVVFGGGIYDGVIATDMVRDTNLLVRAYALTAMHPRPARILQIGLGTAAWTHALLALPGVEDITAVEINAGYVPLINRHREVRAVLRDPRLKVVIDDGRRWLARHPDARFDAIVMNTTWHWRAHSANLLSAEFLQLARAHLRPGGILYYNTTWSPDAMRTAFTVFPYGLRVVNFVAVSDSPIPFDVGRWTALLEGLRRDDGRPVFDRGDQRVAARLDSLLAFPTTVRDGTQGYGLETREAVLREVSNAQLVTDDNMRVEWRPTPLASASGQASHP